MRTLPDLSAYAEGTWIILNPSMTEVLGAGETPEEAMRQAKIEPSGPYAGPYAAPEGGCGHPHETSATVQPRPVIFQVPGPGPHY